LYIQNLNFPGRPDLSTLLSHVSSSQMDEWIATVSQTVSKRLFTGFSLIDGFGVLSTIKQNVLPFFRTSDLNLEGLTLNLAHLISLSRPWRIHLLPGTEDVETVRLSIQALIGGCPTPDLDSFGNHVHGKCKKDY